jgi:hypothetical protein
MEKKIENLPTEDIQVLIKLCIATTNALAERNDTGFDNMELGRIKVLEILQWLIDKDFLEK